MLVDAGLPTLRTCLVGISFIIHAFTAARHVHGVTSLKIIFGVSVGDPESCDLNSGVILPPTTEHVSGLMT